MAIAAVGSMAGVAAIDIVATATPAAAAGCTGDTWTNTAGGAWETGTNWSTNAPPTSTQAACITTPGTYTITMANETESAGAVTLGGSGVAATLNIGNGGEGYPNITFASVAVGSGSTLDFNYGGTLTVTGAFTNAGTVDTGSTYLSTLNIASFDNQGTFSSGALGTNYTLPSSTATFLNDTAGTLDVPDATGAGLVFSSPSGDTGTVTQDGVIDLTSATSFDVNDAFTVEGGSICGAAAYVGTNGGSIGTLNFASTVSTGATCGSGVTTDNIDFNNVNSNGTLSGNIPKAYTVEMGNGGSGFPDITLSGAITNSGTLEMGWEGTFTDTSTLTNKGTLEVPASAYLSNWDFTNLVNKKALVIDANVNLPIAASGSLDNASTGTITVAASTTLNVSSTATPQGSVTQDGIIDNSGTFEIQAPLSVSGGSICGNQVQVGTDAGSTQSLTFAGTVVPGPTCATGLKSDHLFIANITGPLNGSVPKGYTVIIGDGGSSYAHVTSSATSNAGVLEVEDGATMTFTGASFTNTGTLEFPTNTYSSTEFIFNSNVTNSGKITIDAVGGTFVLPTGDTLTNSKKIKLAGSGTLLNITGALVNTKSIQVAAGDTLSVSKTFSQSSTGTLTPQIASGSSWGQLSVVGTASLAGTITGKLAASYHPALNTTWKVMQSAGLGSTTFTTVTSPFTAQYISSDDDVQLTYS